MNNANDDRAIRLLVPASLALGAGAGLVLHDVPLYAAAGATIGYVLVAARLVVHRRHA